MRQCKRKDLWAWIITIEIIQYKTHLEKKMKKKSQWVVEKIQVA